MIARVIVGLEDDSGVVLWHYSLAEAVPSSDDPEQITLEARGIIAEGLKGATESIGKQADQDLENARKARGDD